MSTNWRDHLVNLAFAVVVMLAVWVLVALAMIARHYLIGG